MIPCCCHLHQHEHILKNKARLAHPSEKTQQTAQSAESGGPWCRKWRMHYPWVYPLACGAEAQDRALGSGILAE